MTPRAASLTLIAALCLAGCTSGERSMEGNAKGGGKPAADASVSRTAHDTTSPAPPAPSDPHAAHRASDAAPPATPAGFAPITLDPERATAIKLTTATLEERDFTKIVRTVGLITTDETKTSHVHAKVRGFIENISVAFVGQKVTRGQALCSIYSQEVFAAELEYLTLFDRAPGRVPLTGQFAEAEDRAQKQMADAARRRLSLWDVPKGEIDRLERTREARRTFTLAAPRAGVVVAKQAVLGMFIDPSVELYLVSDLSRVWAQVDVYEADLPFMKVGQAARLTVAGLGEPINAEATFIAPVIDEATRTLKVRFELDNKEGIIRPGSFVTAEISLALGRGLGVPESAVIRTGQRAIVFVVHGSHIEPREVTVGPLVGDYFRASGGLSAGEVVATGAQFLIDSESRLRATSSPTGGHAH